MSDLKFCKNCKYVTPDPWSYIPFVGKSFDKFAKCSHPQFVEVNLVTGESTISRYCATARIFDCGEKAKYFEPK